MVWHNVSLPGETPQAQFLREQVLPRLVWLVLGIAGWGVTVFIATGVWQLNITANRYHEYEAPPRAPTVLERVVRFPEKQQDPKSYRDAIVATLDGRAVTEREITYAVQQEKFDQDRADMAFGAMYGYGRRPCVGLPDGCYKPDKPSEVACQALALIVGCVDIAALGFSMWLLLGAITCRRFSI